MGWYSILPSRPVGAWQGMAYRGGSAERMPARSLQAAGTFTGADGTADRSPHFLGEPPRFCPRPCPLSARRLQEAEPAQLQWLRSLCSPGRRSVLQFLVELPDVLCQGLLDVGGGRSQLAEQAHRSVQLVRHLPGLAMAGQAPQL